MNHDSPILLVLILVILSACNSGYYIRMNPNQPITSTESGKPLPEKAISIQGSAHSLFSGHNDVYHRDGRNRGSERDQRYDTNSMPMDRSASLGFRYQIDRTSLVGVSLQMSEMKDRFLSDEPEHSRYTLILSNTIFDPKMKPGDKLIASFHLMAGFSLIGRDRYFYSNTVFEDIPGTVRRDDPSYPLYYEFLAEPTLFAQLSDRVGLTLAPQMYFTFFGRRMHQRMGFRPGLSLEPTRFIRVSATVPWMSRSWAFGQGGAEPGSAAFLENNTLSSTFSNLNISVQLLLNP